MTYSSNLFLGFAKFLSVIGLLGSSGFLPDQAHAASCDVVKLYAISGNVRFAASGVVIRRGERNLILTTDHFLPLDRIDFPITASLSATDSLTVSIFKRDWGSDLMILTAKTESQADALNKLKPCPFIPAAQKIEALSSVSLIGFPAQDFTGVIREGILVDTSSKEARIARPLRQLKILTLAEKGMSGGAVLTRDGQLLGLIQKEWTSLTERSKGGAFALFAPDLNAQVALMLKDKSGSVEMPLPFKIRRSEGEMQFGGFRIQDRPEVLNKDLSPMNGGHPDGIGGEVPDAGVEIVGLTGERVPETFKAMENILRNIQAKGGVRMVIQGTETGQPILDLIALARLLLSGSDIPDLDYNLIDVRSDSSAPRTGSPESLMEEAIVLTSILNHANPGLREYAQLIKNSYERWLQSRSSKSVQELFTSEAEFQPELDRILDLAPDLWPKVVDLQTTLLQLKKSLHRI